MQELTFDTLANLSGEIIAIATLIFIVRYFMTAIEKKDKQLYKVMETMSQTVHDNTMALNELKAIIQRFCYESTPPSNGNNIRSIK